MKISIVTPSYNQGEFLGRTIESVLSQNWPTLEYLIIDGGSTDSTIGILRNYGNRIKSIYQIDLGHAERINKGLEASTGEIIGWLNPGDIYFAGAAESVISYFSDHPDIDVVYGMADYIDVNDKPLEPYPTEPWDLVRLKWTCFLCQPAVFFRRSVVERNDLLDMKLKYCLDYEYWLRLGSAGVRFGYLEAKLAGSRVHQNRNVIKHKVEAYAEIVDMFREQFGYLSKRWLSNYNTAIDEERRVTKWQAEFQSELGAAGRKATQLQIELNAITLELNAITQSTSWRSTEPLRLFGTKHPNIARLARQILKLLFPT